MNNKSSLIKSAWSPFAMNPDVTGKKPVQSLSGVSPKPVMPLNPSQLNIHVKNQQQANRFTNTLLKKNFRQPQNSQQRYNISSYIQKFPPTPDGVPYRRVTDFPKSGEYQYQANQADINTHTDLLNRSGLFPEKLSPMEDIIAYQLNNDIAPNTPIYQADGRSLANWLWNRRGLQFTDEQWNRASKARQNATSQLHSLPQSVYYAWSNNKDVNAYSMPFKEDGYKNNQFINVFNPNHFDNPYKYDTYSGFSLRQQDGKALTPGQRFLDFQESQDHELSHSFNDIVPAETYNTNEENNMFFRKTNNPEQPYYDRDTTFQRISKFNDLFADTYLNKPIEYIGAMSRVKRYGAELGFDTTSPDPDKARAAMAQTLQYFATHQNPEELTGEQQRLHSWLNTAARNYNREQQKYRKGILPYFYHNYIKDPTGWSPFYKEVLDFMTDSTIQGLVQTNPNNLNNTHLA